MVFPHGKGDLYHKYRPRKFCEIVGNEASIHSIQSAIFSKNPSQSYLLVGESGCGKTTTARIMAAALNCEDPLNRDPCLVCSSCKHVLHGSCPDVMEINAADSRGIDGARTLRADMGMMPMFLKNKVYILDEAHGLTNDAQSSLLKVLEEAPSHVYIILCTTNPKKIKATVRNRCQIFTFPKLNTVSMRKLLDSVATFEGIILPDSIYAAIISKGGGSPRKSLVLLQQIKQLGGGSKEKMLSLLEEDPGDAGLMVMYKAILTSKVTWFSVSRAYNSCKHLGAESIWLFLAGSVRNKLLKETSNLRKANLYGFMLDLLSQPIPAVKPENMLVNILYKISTYREPK